MKRIVTTICLCVCAVSAQAAVIATFDASLGTTPADQGWTHFEVRVGPIAAGTNNMEAGVLDGGATVLHVKDQVGDDSYNLPTFYVGRTEAQNQDLWDNGLRISMEAKDAGGWFMGFGFNNSIFTNATNIGADHRIGANINALPDDGAYHSIEIIGGQSGTEYLFTISVDGSLPSPMAIQGNSSNPTFQDAFSGQSGSSGGTSAEAYFKSIMLQSIPEPSTMILLGIGAFALGMRKRR